MNTAQLNITEIFGYNNALLYPYIKIVIKENIGKKYFHLNDMEYIKLIQNSKTRGLGNKILWREIFDRIHYASILNLLRTDKWLQAILTSFQSENLLSFCTSTRGIIEFASDSNYTFGAIPFHLAEEFNNIKPIFSQNIDDKIIINQALEDALLHFTFAGVKGKKNERSNVYNAKQIKQYIDYSDNKGKLYDFYKYLSGYVHPSTESVLSYLDIHSVNNGETFTVIDNDKYIINKIIKDNQTLFENILSLSIYPSLFNLKILDMFKIPEYKCNSITAINYEQFEIWKKIISKIKNYA